jgi:hypothetical protein
MDVSSSLSPVLRVCPRNVSTSEVRNLKALSFWWDGTEYSVDSRFSIVNQVLGTRICRA